MVILIARLTTVYSQVQDQSGGWVKYEINPVLGGRLGAIYDACVLKNKDGTFQLYFSWYDRNSIAVTESKDGVNWSSPLICITAEGYGINRDHFNKPCVIKKDGTYHLWYCHEDAVQSTIEYAVSNDGKKWTKKSGKPVLTAGLPWEKAAIQYPHVIWDCQERLFRMWYAAGEQAEPDAIGYAVSKDGLLWVKDKSNPIFKCDSKNPWEQAKVGGCQVIKRKDDYLMFYTGYRDPGHAQIGMARSKDGITNWERYTDNPVVRIGFSGWDSYAIYKPFAVPDSAGNRWLLYYDGRRGWNNQVGLVIHAGMDLNF